MASTPFGAQDRFGTPLFPEAALPDALDYGFNRAKLAWYNIEPVLQERNSPNNPLSGNLNELSDPQVRFVNRVEVFPQSTPDLGQNQLITFDMAFYPTDRGPYNYDARPSSIDPLTGKLKNPQSRWGGIMRAIDQIDFETNNIEFIEMWMLDPFIYNTTSRGGDLYFNLGNISEDILKDGRKSMENGLPVDGNTTKTENTIWGRVPKLQPVIQAFDNNPTAKELLKIPVYKSEELNSLRKPNDKIIIAIGDNELRKKKVDQLEAILYTTAIHPSAIVSSNASIGEGTVVMASTVINTGAKIGKHVIINTGALIEHDCIIEDFAHVSPKAALAGNVIVKEGAQVGQTSSQEHLKVRV
jgi:sugar O-acyltransferase (sialic acid O-acetyltransferase NeuD family)